jgi:hypothetical protein
VTGKTLAAVSIAGVWLVGAEAQQSRETVNLSIKVTGVIDAAKREPNDFTVENWTMKSTFTQSSELTVFREGGKIGGAPAALFGMMRAQGEDLFQPIVSPFDPVTHAFTGEVRVAGCASHRSALTAGMKPPAGVPLDISGAMSLADKGTYLLQLCAANVDRVLVFYEPPPGFYTAPAAGPLRCSDDYSYQRDEASDNVFDASLIQEKSAAAAARACTGHEPNGTESMVYVGSASWRSLLNGELVTFDQSLQGSDGDKTKNESYREMAVRLTLAVQPHK